MKGLREVEVTVIVPGNFYAVDVATTLLRALRGYSPEAAINVKVCAVEEEAPQRGGQPKALDLWCVECDVSLRREDYDEKHDRYRCPECDKLVEADKVEA